MARKVFWAKPRKPKEEDRAKRDRCKTSGIAWPAKFSGRSPENIKWKEARSASGENHGHPLNNFSSILFLEIRSMARHISGRSPEKKRKIAEGDRCKTSGIAWPPKFFGRSPKNYKEERAKRVRCKPWTSLKQFFLNFISRDYRHGPQSFLGEAQKT